MPIANDEPVSYIRIRVRKELKKQIHTEAIQNDMNLQDFCEILLKRGLLEYENEKKV